MAQLWRAAAACAQVSAGAWDTSASRAAAAADASSGSDGSGSGSEVSPRLQERRLRVAALQREGLAAAAAGQAQLVVRAMEMVRRGGEAFDPEEDWAAPLPPSPGR